MAEAVTVQDVFEELKRIEGKMATKDDVASLMETIEIVSNPNTMRQIVESIEDIKNGRVKEIHSVQNMLDEM